MSTEHEIIPLAQRVSLYTSSLYYSTKGMFRIFQVSITTFAELHVATMSAKLSLRDRVSLSRLSHSKGSFQLPLGDTEDAVILGERFCKLGADETTRGEGETDTSGRVSDSSSSPAAPLTPTQAAQRRIQRSLLMTYRTGFSALPGCNLTRYENMQRASLFMYVLSNSHFMSYLISYHILLCSDSSTYQPAATSDGDAPCARHRCWQPRPYSARQGPWRGRRSEGRSREGYSNAF